MKNWLKIAWILRPWAQETKTRILIRAALKAGRPVKILSLPTVDPMDMRGLPCLNENSD